MKSLILDFMKLKKFNDEKPYKETLWSGDTSRINLISLLPGQQIKPHIHDGDHIWIVMEGSGELLSSEEDFSEISAGKIAVVPSGEKHGIRNNTSENLVFASVTV